MYRTPHGTAIPDPSQALINILVKVSRCRVPGPAHGPAAPFAGGEAVPEAEDGEVGNSGHHQRRIGPFFSAIAFSASGPRR
jgi:hypothetical protein